MVHRGSTLTAALIIAPRGSAGAETEITPFDDVAASVMLLASSCYDSDRLGLLGLELLVELACRCPSWHLGYHDLSHASHQVALAFEQSSDHKPIEVRHRKSQPRPKPTPPGNLHHSSDVHSWYFGDGSAVLFRPDTRQMTRLNHLEARTWELLGQPHPFEELLSLVDDSNGRTRLQAWVQSLVDSKFLALSPYPSL